MRVVQTDARAKNQRLLQALGRTVLSMGDVIDVTVDLMAGALILDSVNNREGVPTERFPTPPNFVKGGPGLVVIDAGGRGKVHARVRIEPSAPSMSDAEMATWEETQEATFSCEDTEMFLDGSTGEVVAPFSLAIGMYRIRVHVRGRDRWFDSYTAPDGEPRIALELHIWPDPEM
ncbi:hypothetical protein [Rhodococcus sp. ARC_M5]|uniref:hypothetical protein n=1 Tax=Rhodococcus sp. ARC_M5 TaxID=2928851 RepID=UPI001FB46923|nr:hypothetical protein [Rhodococcus sp. ARC_M5]MCJ0892118.1 hypothetical protein [Rhodococcus sp. ARC_M5]